MIGKSEIRVRTTSATEGSSLAPPLSPSPQSGSKTIRDTYGFKDWKDENLYFVMVDRFSNGDPSNDPPSDLRDPRAYHGGDFKGLQGKLDYLKNLGVTTLWISPPMKNQEKGYHGYWPRDFYKVEEHFGTPQDLKELVKQAHEKGLKVIMDLVLNHTGYDHPWVKDPAYHQWFHHVGRILLPTRWYIEHGNLAGLPDLAHENPKVASYLTDMAKFWINETGVDGFRIDAIKYINRTFLTTFVKEIQGFAGKEFLFLGEDFSGSPAHLAQYQKIGVQTLFDFPLNVSLRSAIAEKGKPWLTRFREALRERRHAPLLETWRKATKRAGDMRAFSKVFSKDHLYVDPKLLTVFVDNHDMTRFLDECGGRHNTEKLKLALGLIFSVRGVPSVLYGTEAGMEGGNDPDNRRDMEWGKNPSLIQHFHQLVMIRNSSVSLRQGEQKELYADREVYAFSRTYDGIVTNVGSSPPPGQTTPRPPSAMTTSQGSQPGGNQPNPVRKHEETVAAFSNSEREEVRTISLKGMTSARKPLVNLLNRSEILFPQDGKVTLKFKPFEAKIFAPLGEMR